MGKIRGTIATLAGLGVIAGLLGGAPVASSDEYPPSPTPTATATPEPTPTPTPTAAFLPSPPPAGGATVLIGGTAVDATVAVNERAGRVEVTAGGMLIVIDTKTPGGGNLTAEGDGTLNLNVGGDVASSGRGFVQGTPVNFYLIAGSQATFLGSLRVFSDGTYAGGVAIPGDIATGIYTLQINGLTDATRARALVTRVISISVLVRVIEPTAEPKAVRTLVYFDVYSAKLSKSAKRQLDILVSKLPRRSGNLVRIVGYVGAGGVADIVALSNARANAVSNYLKSKGVSGTYKLRAGGISGLGPQARHANVLVLPNKGS